MRISPSSPPRLAAAACAVALAAVGGTGGAQAETEGGVATSAAGSPRRAYHLLLTTNRDGDRDVYGASADGRRLAVLTRNGLDDDPVAASPDGRWIAVSRPRLVRPVQRGGTFLLSGDGRRQRLVAEDRGWVFNKPIAFSPDSSWLAVEREHLLQEVTRTVLVPTRGGRERVLGDGSPGPFSPNGRYLVTGNRVRDLRTRATWRTGAGDVRWSPRGRRLALVRYDGRSETYGLYVLDVRRRGTRPRRLLRATSLEARWLDDSRLGYVREVEVRNADDELVSRRADLGVVTAGGAVRVVHRARAYVQADWSPRGDFVAFSTEAGTDEDGRSEYEHRLLSADGRTSRALLAYPEWSPTGRRYVVAVKRDRGHRLLVVEPRTGRVTRTIPWYASAYSLVWSPDERHIAFHTRRGEARDVRIAELGSGRTRVVLRGGSSAVAAWVGGRLPASARPAPPPPPIERAAASGFRSEGELVEIAASGSRVAALVDASRRDCDHAVAWTVGRRAVSRFTGAAPCEGSAPVPYGEYFFRLKLAGTRLTWKGFHCGNDCYHTDYWADLRRPGRQGVGDEIGVGDEGRPPHPPPRPESHRGVAMAVARGAIRLRRARDGRAATIRPRGVLVDADLEPTGLFYAYNDRRGTHPGRLVFVPFDRLLAR